MSKATRIVRPLGDLLRVFTGPGLWAIHFAVIYGAEALICTKFAATQSRIMIWTAGGASLAALVALVAFAAMLMQQRRTDAAAPGHSSAAFLRSVALFLALLSMLGVIWATLPLAFLPACAPAG